MSLLPFKSDELFLGALLNPETGNRGDTPLQIPPRNLTTHGVCIGMTGSGKTGLCVALLEECGLQGIPQILIDPKGDLTNLKLLFPDLVGSDFETWMSPDEAAREGSSVEALAKKKAQTWKNGLESWGIDGSRLEKLRSSCDIRIFTPGSTAGQPLSILRSFDAPPIPWDDHEETLREEIAGAVSALLGLLGIESDPISGREHIFLANLLEQRWKMGARTDLSSLIHLIQNPPFGKLGALGIDQFFPPNDRSKLALQLNGLLAAPSFQSWMSGEALEIPTLLKAPDGRPRISILYIAHLNDAERMFFVTLLLNALITWMRGQGGTERLRALLYFDEIFGYLPPHPKDPPSKRPLLTLLKQARAFGIGCMLVTQNPVDLDYKALSNCGTWLIGRLQTGQDRQRILDGLRSAIESGGSGLNVEDLHRLLPGLKMRQFLLASAREGKAALFESRWAMSYLAGPLTRSQIRTLENPEKRDTILRPAQNDSTNPTANRGGDTSTISNSPPALASGLNPWFEEGAAGQMKPWFYAHAEVVYPDRSSGLTISREARFFHPPCESLARLDWSLAVEGDPTLMTQPSVSMEFGEVPSAVLAREAAKEIPSTFIRYLAGSYPLVLLHHAQWKLMAESGESDESFRARVRAEGNKRLDEQSQKLTDAADKKIATASERLSTEQLRLRQREDEIRARQTNLAGDILGGLGGAILSALGGRRGSAARKVGSALKRTGSSRVTMERSQGQIELSKERVDQLTQTIATLRAGLRADLSALRLELQTSIEAIEERRILPTRTNIRIRESGVAWLAAGTLKSQTA